MTTRGFREAEMREVGALIAEVLEHIANEDAIARVRQRVDALTARFPLYQWKKRKPAETSAVLPESAVQVG